MKIRLSKKTAIYTFVVTITTILSIIYLNVLNNLGGNLKHAVLFQFLVFIFLFIALGKTNKSYVTLYSIFMIAFYVFQNGQLLLYALNVDYDFWYVRKYSEYHVFESVVFSTYCMLAAFFSAGFSFKEKENTFGSVKLRNVQDNLIFSYAKIGLAFSGVTAFGLLALKFIIVISGGYSAVLLMEARVPSLIGLIELMYPAFSILYIIYGEDKHSNNIIKGLFLVWGIITALTGDRTTGLGVIIILLFMSFKRVNRRELTESNTSKVKKYIAALIGCIAVVYLIPLAFSFRQQEAYSINTLFDSLVSVFGELGFSFFPLTAMMEICPNIQPFLYGKSMIGSIISGFVPESIDILGVFSEFSEDAWIPVKYIMNRFDYGFGMDCSLNAECYANFGVYGYMAMFVICSIVASMLKNVDYRKDSNKFNQYSGIVLLFGWFTLPRRRSYYIYNKIFWYVVIIVVIILMMNAILKKVKRTRG